MIVFFVVSFIVIMAVAIVAGIISGVRQSTPYRHKPQRTESFYHPTKANSNPLPLNSCFYNIGSTVCHQSKECSDFSLMQSWDAITRSEAASRGFTVCSLCKESIVFVYPRGRVYHNTKFCSDSQSIPYQISEKEAIAKGLHRCEKCW